MVNASAWVVKSLPAMTASFMRVSTSRSVNLSPPSAAWRSYVIEIVPRRLSTLVHFLLEKCLHVLRITREIFVALLSCRFVLDGVGRAARPSSNRPSALTSPSSRRRRQGGLTSPSREAANRTDGETRTRRPSARISSISFRVISRVCGSIAATRSGVKACCMRALTRVCFGGSSRKSVSILVSSSAPGTGQERWKAAENVLKSRRIASQSAQRRKPSAPDGSTRQTGPLARSSASSRLPSLVKLGLLKSRTGNASKPAGTGLVAPVATLCCSSDIDGLLGRMAPYGSFRGTGYCMNHPWLTTIDWPEETSDLLRLSTPQGSIAYVSVVCQPGTDKSGIVFSCNWQVELAGATMGKFWLELKCAVRRRILARLMQRFDEFAHGCAGFG